MTQPCQVDLCVDSRGLATAVSQNVPDNFQRLVPTQKMTRQSMTKAMWASAVGIDPQSLHSPRNRRAHLAQRAVRRAESQEYFSSGTAGTDVFQVSIDRIANGRCQRKYVSRLALGPHNMDLVTIPIDVLQPQSRYLATPKTIDHAEQHHRTVTNVDRPVRLHAIQEAYHIFALRTHGQSRMLVEARSRQSLGDGWLAQATTCRISEERSQRIEDGGRCYTRPSLLFVGHGEEFVDVFRTCCGKSMSTRLVPRQELANPPATVLYGSIRQPSLVLHPMAVVSNHVFVPQRFRCRFTQTIHKAKPTYCLPCEENSCLSAVSSMRLNRLSGTHTHRLPSQSGCSSRSCQGCVAPVGQPTRSVRPFS